jgi:hypothetical protein
MENFSDILLSLDDASHIEKIELFYPDGEAAGVIAYKPGNAGSIKVYNHLFNMYGEISLDAAVEGLSLYAEHTFDAENSPGKHPHIDRLLDVLENEESLTVKLTQAPAHA